MFDELINEILEQYFNGKSINSILKSLKSNLTDEDLETIKLAALQKK